MDIDTEMDIEINSNESAYLKGIQNLPGETPPQKFQYLNDTISKIIATTQDNDDIVSILKTQKFSNSIIPLVQILIGNRTKSYEAVLNALKSTDYRIVRKALHAKWFFHCSNQYLEVDFFLNNIIPHLSFRNRYRILNVISRCFVNSKEKAESYFQVLFAQYGLEYALLFLPYCSERFIFNVILTNKMHLSDKLLSVIHRVQPKVAIRYLHLGNEHNKNNVEEQKIHKININCYRSFLPKIVKTHPRDFLELLRCLSPKQIKLSNKSSNYLCNFDGKTIAENSQTFVNILSLKSISNCLGKQLFEEFYMNLFPSTSQNFKFYRMLYYLKYRLASNRLQFLIDTFYKKYRDTFSYFCEKSNIIYEVKSNLTNIYGLISQEEFETLYFILFSNTRSFRNDMLLLLQYYPKEKKIEILEKVSLLSIKQCFYYDKTIHITEILELFPNKEREEIAGKLMEMYEKDSDEYFQWCCYLPLKNSYDILKSAAETESKREQVYFIKKMIDTCILYNNQKHLLLVMTYFRNVCIEKPKVNVIIILEYLAEKFSIKSLDESNWQIFYELLLKLYVKDQLFSSPKQCVENILHEALYRLFYQVSELPSESDLESSLSRMIHMYLEYKIECNETKWTFLEKYSTVEFKFVDRIIHELPIIYPENHVIWKVIGKKLKILTWIIDVIIEYNSRAIKRKETNDVVCSDFDKNVIKIHNYPWLLKYTMDVLKNENENGSHFLNFKNLVKRFAPDFYLSMLSQIRFHSNDIIDGKAQFLLKFDKQNVICNWKKYLSTCRKLLCSSTKSHIQAAKKFIRSTIWYNDLAEKMFNECLFEIDEPGSLKVLGLYLDGQSLNNILSKYYPTESTIDVKKSNARQMYRIQSAIPAAIVVSEAPIALEIFCQIYRGEYFTLAKPCIVPLGLRIQKSLLIIAVKQFIKNEDHLSKYGIHLIFQIASNDELYEFCNEMSTHHSFKYKKLMTRKIFNRFKICPTPKTWLLLNYWIDILNSDNDSLDILCQVAPIKNVYTHLYITKLLNKIEELQNAHSMDPKWKEKYVQTILKSIREYQVVLMPRKTILDILRRYYSKSNTKGMECAVQSFACIVFSLSFDKVKSLPAA